MPVPSFLQTNTVPTLVGTGAVQIYPPALALPDVYESSVVQQYIKNAIEQHQHNITNSEIPSFDFRVVEWVNDNGDIVKVGLQYKTVYYNSFGSLVREEDWKSVERIQSVI